MTRARRTILLELLGCAALGVFTGCSSEPPPPEFERYAYLNLCAKVPECDSNVTVGAESPALVVTDPEVLAALPLEDVLDQLLERSGDASSTPTSMLQRMFDTNNASYGAVFDDEVHCDSSENMAHQNGPAAFCPRKEGELAKSTGFFTPGNKDHFRPVAVLNRFDLATTSGGSCGEYRIIYAKESGLEDPQDRLFMIFEATLPNPNPDCMLGCRPVAEFWQELESEKDPEVLGEKLRSFFMEGLPGFSAPIDPQNLGLGSVGGYNGGFTGQVRVSQQMDEHWELRQLGFQIDFANRLRFVPVAVGNNPRPSLFEPSGTSEFGSTKELFLEDFAMFSVEGLAASTVAEMGTTMSLSYLSGESALGGDAVNDYASRAEGHEELFAAIQQAIDDQELGADCPPDDPLTPEAILRRATAQSCAGCHAPTKFLGPERKLGCGLTFPDTLGEVHIDERGELSPALREVFLPHRANVLGTYLQACDADAITKNFGGGTFGGGGGQTEPMH